MIQRLLGGVASEEDVSLEPPGKGNSQLVLGELSSRDAKDPVKLFQSALHGFRNPEENHDKGDDIEPRVQGKCPDSIETFEQEWERDPQNRSLWYISYTRRIMKWMIVY